MLLAHMHRLLPWTRVLLEAVFQAIEVDDRAEDLRTKVI